MPELREVFEMTTRQMGEPDLDAWQEQERRQRTASRNKKLGAFAMAAALVIVAVLVVVLNGTDATDRGTRTNEPAHSAPPSAPDAYLLDLATGQTTQAAGSASIASPGIAVSPNGTTVAYPGINPEARHVIYVASVDGTNVRPLERTASGMGLIGPQFSPDGSRIVYQARGLGSVGDIFVVDVVSGQTTQVTHLEPVSSDLYYMGPNFSPDGETVFFTLPVGDLFTRRWDLWSVPASGGTPRLVIRGAIGGRISPDGRTIVYFKREPTSLGLLGDMWLADADGTNARRLGAVRGDVFSARWSPDGTRIAFVNMEERKSAYVVDVTTGEVSRVLEDVVYRVPEWVDDHTWIVGAD
jgi:Tol biopolymer transport system component